MTLRTMVMAGLLLLGIPSLASAQLVNEQQVQDRLQQAGYTDVHDVKLGGEGIIAKAEKDGKEWSLALDSAGKIIRSEQR